MLPASLGASARSTSEFDLGFFQVTASVLGFRVCEVLCAPFKSGVCVSYSPLTVLYLSPVPFKATCFEGVIFQLRTARLGRTSAIVIVFLFVGCLPGSGGLDYTVSAPATHVIMVPSLYH